MSGHENSAIVQCDACHYGFVIDESPLQEQPVYINNVRLVVTYFLCPRCRKVYVVAIYDGWCLEFLEKYRKKMQLVTKYQKKSDIMGAYWRGQASALAKQLQKRMQALQNHYTGLFTVIDDGELIYQQN